MNKAQFSERMFDILEKADNFVTFLHQNPLIKTFRTTYGDFLREEDHDGDFPSVFVVLFEGLENEEEIEIYTGEDRTLKDIVFSKETLEESLYLYYQDFFTSVADQDVSYSETKNVLQKYSKMNSEKYEQLVTSYLLTLLHNEFSKLSQEIQEVTAEYGGKSPFQNISLYDMYFSSEKYYISSRCW